jgi:hypothetical protein
MEIGKPKRIYTVEPIESPVPAPAPVEPAETPDRRPEPSEAPLARP